MPSRWEFATDAEEIEESALAPPTEHTATFDGYWKATAAYGSTTKQTVVCISGTNIWYNCEKYATLRVVNRNTCVLITKDEDVKGHLSDNGHKIDWDDGDCWLRHVEKPKPQVAPPDGQSQGAGRCGAEPKEAAGGASGGELGESTQCKLPSVRVFGAADATRALFSRDAALLRAVLDDGVAVGTEVDPAQLWEHMKWNPEWTGPAPPTPLLVAAILLQWPPGVEACVQHGADVNGTYAGPFRCADGRAASEAAGAHILRVALSARGPAQCTMCQHILAGKIRGRTFQNVKRKAKTEMEFATAGFFDSYQGPFAQQ